MECGIRHLRSSLAACLVVIYCYQLLILVKNIFIILILIVPIVGTIVVIVVKMYVVTCK